MISLLAQATVPVSLGSIIVAPIAVGIVGFLVKFWIGQQGKSIEEAKESLKSIADSMAELAETVGAHGRDLAVLQARRESDADEIRGLRERQHELGNEIQRLSALLALMKREA